jgi:hypothetical protein
MKNTLSLLLAIAMVATGYYFYKKSKGASQPVNINIAFNSDSALHMVQQYYNAVPDTLANKINNIALLNYKRKSLDTVFASFSVVATPKKIKIGGQSFSYKYTEHWRYYYTNSKWIGSKSNIAW